MYILEVSLDTSVVRMLFINKRQAENARRKIAKEMEKGQFRNKDDVVEIKSDASTYSISPSRVRAVSVNDQDAWMNYQAEEVRKRIELGIYAEREKYDKS